MKYALLATGLVLAFPIGCSEKTIECKNGSVDTETSSLAQGEGGFCRYYNPHGKGTDCRSYEGSSWTEDEIRLDCSDAMGEKMAKPGTLSNEECSPEGLLGSCLVELGNGKSTITYYYSGDIGALNSFCEANGIWTPNGSPLEGMALATPEALEALVPDTAVEVDPNCQDTECLEQVIENEEWFEFRPLGSQKADGVIFFPGGGVDPRAYAPAARAFAEAGYFTVIAPHYGSTLEKVEAIASANSAHAKWFVGGHSYGGITAIRYVSTAGIENLAGLYLWAAYGTSVYNISGTDIETLVVYAENDKLSTPEFVAAGKKYLPKDAIYELINGGNHAQFGYYGVQEGDGAATITQEAQQEAARGFTLDFFDGTL